MIRQGEIYWVDLDEPLGSEPGYRRPFVVIQNDLFNSSRISTVVVCALTTNLRRAAAPGNVLLDPGEGNLPQQSVVNVSQLLTVDRVRLEARIGGLSIHRIRAILDGIALLIAPYAPYPDKDRES